MYEYLYSVDTVDLPKSKINNRVKLYLYWASLDAEKQKEHNIVKPQISV